MALSKDIQFKPVGLDSEITVKSAYHRVSDFYGDKYNFNFTVSVFQTADSKEALFSHGYSFIPKMENSNFIQQAYEHLKTLPEFAGAADV